MFNPHSCHLVKSHTELLKFIREIAERKHDLFQIYVKADELSKQADSDFVDLGKDPDCPMLALKKGGY